MRSVVVTAIVALVFGASCGRPSVKREGPSPTPLSIRGWISDIRPPGAARPSDPVKLAAWVDSLFPDCSVIIDGIPYASGGVAADGSFIILDAPPGQVTLDFSAPGIPDARLTLTGLPPNADVLLPGIILTGSGAVLAHPEMAVVRIPSDRVRKTTRLPMTAGAGAARIAVYEAPFNDLGNRRDYPDPGGTRPLAVVK